MKLQRLKELALGATQGEWQAKAFINCTVEPKPEPDQDTCALAIMSKGTDWKKYDDVANANYIAAACPANILPFLESYEELLRELHYAKQYLPVSVVVRRSVYKAITNAEKLSQ